MVSVAWVVFHHAYPWLPTISSAQIVRVSSHHTFSTELGAVTADSLGERVPTPVVLPPLGTLELFVELNDASGGSGANFIIKWDADSPINPPLVESLHANMDGGKAVVFMTQSVPVADPAGAPARQ